MRQSTLNANSWKIVVCIDMITSLVPRSHTEHTLKIRETFWQTAKKYIHYIYNEMREKCSGSSEIVAQHWNITNSILNQIAVTHSPDLFSMHNSGWCDHISIHAGLYTFLLIILSFEPNKWVEKTNIYIYSGAHMYNDFNDWNRKKSLLIRWNSALSPMQNEMKSIQWRECGT